MSNVRQTTRTQAQVQSKVVFLSKLRICNLCRGLIKNIENQTKSFNDICMQGTVDKLKQMMPISTVVWWKPKQICLSVKYKGKPKYIKFSAYTIWSVVYK